MIDSIVATSALVALAIAPLATPVAQQSPKPSIPSPAPAPRPEPGPPGGVTDLSGFSVVLVVGETQQAPGTPAGPELPQGARRALNDMREFLPYKNYRVLDAQWMSCCSLVGPRTVSGRLEGVTGVPGPNAAAVRGYNFAISVSPSYGNLPVRFVLSPDDGGFRKPPSGERVRELERERHDIQAEIEMVEAEIKETEKRVDIGVIAASQLTPLRNRQASLKRKLADISAAVEELSTMGGGRPIIDSGFTMQAGETVVVGTSRLGGDKALIALVTAVKKSATSKDTERR